jgi:hypothetical protein
VVIQYIYKNTNFSNTLNTIPSTSSPFNGLSTLLCYDASPNGYICSITPQNTNSKIKVQFKVQYQTSDIYLTSLTLGIVFTTDNGNSYSLVGQDIFCGTVNGSGPLTNTYTFNYMHSPSTTNTITYQMFYQLQGNSKNSLGLINSSANCIILEEYLGSGSANVWDFSGNNAIKYTGNVYINGTLDVSGGNIITSSTNGVTYNYYSSEIYASEIDNSYAYQIILCKNGPIILPITGFNTGDWIIIVNLSTTTLDIFQSSINNNLYTINQSSYGANSCKLIFYSKGYSNNNKTYYWIIGS